MKKITAIWSLLLLLSAAVAQAAAGSAASIPAADLLQPAELAALLKSSASDKPLILQVGFRKLYDQAHITGAEYAGPGGEASGLEALRARVAHLPQDTALVIYCGCCPWNHCPNVAAAYDLLHRLGFRRLKVLYIAEDFGTNWVEQGFPTTAGP